MKISFEKKIFLGFVANLLVVFASAWIYLSDFNKDKSQTVNSLSTKIELYLFGVSIILLTIVYFIIRSQFKAKNIAEKLLIENKKLLQSIIDNTSNPISIKKLDGEYLFVNKQFEDLVQKSIDDIIGKTDHDFLSKETADVYRNSDLEVVKALKALKLEETIQKFDGSHTYIASKFPLFDSTGRIYAIGGISTDITERKRNEESIKAGDTFFNMSLDMMVIASHEKFIKINPAVIKILGYSEDELLNQPFFKYIHPDDEVITRAEIKKLKTGTPTIKFENRWICKDGSIKWLSWSASPDLATGFIYARANDVTSLREAQKSLIYSEKFFNMSYDIFFLSQGEYITKINPAFIRIFGFNLKDLEDKPFLSLVHPDDLITTTEAVKKLKSGGSVVNFRVRSICKDGSYRWVVWSGTGDIHTGLIFAAGRDISELIENEESLKITNSFFEMSFDAFFVAKGKQIIKINPAITKTLGYSLSDLENRSFLDLIHPDYVKIANEKLIKRLQGLEGDSKAEYPVRCKDGSYKWVEAMITTNLKTGMVYAILEDITQKKNNEEKLNKYTQELKDNEQQIQSIFSGAPDPVIVIDEENKILKWNPKAETVFGWKASEVDGKLLHEFIIPMRHRELHKKGMEKFLTNGIGPILNKSTEMEAVNKDGVEFPVSLSISPIKIGEKNVFIVFVRDITENKKILNELFENEKTLRLIIENIAEGVVVVNADKKIVMTNYMANKIFGIQEEDQISSNIISNSEVYYPDEKTIFPLQNLPMERAFKGEIIDDIDVVILDSVSREKKRVLISGRPLVNQENEIVAAVVTIKDISKYKQLETELKESESKYRNLIGFRQNGNRPV
ncbi:MAG: PAS domain S-box protein [Bacteroidota bacterium]|nr:PAS domain S-box protein [Bacteroidota bacterium]